MYNWITYIEQVKFNTLIKENRRVIRKLYARNLLINLLYEVDG